jgi:hypothetical protein
MPSCRDICPTRSVDQTRGRSRESPIAPDLLAAAITENVALNVSGSKPRSAQPSFAKTNTVKIVGGVYDLATGKVASCHKIAASTKNYPACPDIRQRAMFTGQFLSLPST